MNSNGARWIRDDIASSSPTDACHTSTRRCDIGKASLASAKDGIRSRVMRAGGIDIATTVVHIARICARGIRTSTVENITNLAGAFDCIRGSIV